jgi:tetratricopeptide (TPR) repeat protein
MLTARVCALVVCCVLAAVAGGPGEALAEEEVTPSVAEATARIAELSAMVQQNPDDVELLIDLGNVYYESNMLDQALAAYEKAAAADSTHAGARLNLGSLLADRGEFDRSIAELGVARGLEPENALIASTLGSAYYGRRQYADAIEMYRLALALEPRSVEGHFNLGVAFADAQMFGEAIREWQEVIAIDPEGSVGQLCRDNIRLMSEFITK